MNRPPDDILSRLKAMNAAAHEGGTPPPAGRINTLSPVEYSLLYAETDAAQLAKDMDDGVAPADAAERLAELNEDIAEWQEILRLQQIKAAASPEKNS